MLEEKSDRNFVKYEIGGYSLLFVMGIKGFISFL